MATSAPVLQLARDCETEGLTVGNSEKIAAELARVFGVRQEDVGLLRLDKDSLVFVHPAKLHNVARIPLNTSSAVAVRTANSKKPEIMNNFARVRHASFFEMVDVSHAPKIAGEKHGKEQRLIQKMMSAPVVSLGQVMGVIQVCRKGITAPAAGPDFAPDDLRNLVSIATALAKCFAK